MSSLACTVAVPFPGCSIQLRQTPDEGYIVRAHIRCDRRGGDVQPLSHYNGEESQIQTLDL